MSSDDSIDRVTQLTPIWTLWRLCKSRNGLTYSSKNISETQLVDLIASDTYEWNERTLITSDRANVIARIQRRQREKWNPPPRGWVKCNYDVSHHEGNTNSGMGWIIRNSTGLCLDCGMGQFQERSNIMEAEGSALIWAMQACWSLGYKNVIF